MPALLYDLADRVGGIFAEQFRKAGYDAKAAPIYAHALVGMVAFVGQWWTESPKPPSAETVASHIAALAWMGLRHLPKKPAPVAAHRGRISEARNPHRRLTPGGARLSGGGAGGDRS
jgi:hypothetical protein